MANDFIKKLVTFGDLSQLVNNLKAKFVNQTCLNDYVKKSTYLNNTFRKGTVWFTYDKTDPSTFLGGTWALISEGYYPVATAKEIIDEQNERYVDAELPNVKASVIIPKRKSSSSSATYDTLVGAEGAFDVEDTTNDSPLQYVTNAQNTARQKLSVDLSKSNSTYKDNGKVQPKSVLLYMWVRTDDGIIADDFQALTFNNDYFDVSQNKEITFKPTTSINSSSTDTQIPSAKAVYDTFQNKYLDCSDLSSYDDLVSAFGVYNDSWKAGYVSNLNAVEQAGASSKNGYVTISFRNNNYKMIKFYPINSNEVWSIIKYQQVWGNWEEIYTKTKVDTELANKLNKRTTGTEVYSHSDGTQGGFSVKTSMSATPSDENMLTEKATFDTIFTTTRMNYSSMSSLDDIFTTLNVPSSSMKCGYITNLTPAQTAGASKAAGYIKAFSNSDDYRMLEFYPWDNGKRWTCIKNNGTWGSWLPSADKLTFKNSDFNLSANNEVSINPNFIKQELITVTGSLQVSNQEVYKITIDGQSFVTGYIAFVLPTSLKKGWNGNVVTNLSISTITGTRAFLSGTCSNFDLPIIVNWAGNVFRIGCPEAMSAREDRELCVQFSMVPINDVAQVI